MPTNLKIVTLTSGTSWTVPSDWNSSNNTIHMIGGGAGGGFTGGGGGGGYTKITNLSLTPGQVITYAIGQGGGQAANGTNTTFNSGAYTAGGGKTYTGAGANIGGTGSTYNGGNGGALGAGGAAGPYGAGNPGHPTLYDGGSGDAGYGGAGGTFGSTGGKNGTEIYGVGAGGGAYGSAGGGAGAGGLYGGGGASNGSSGNSGAQGIIVIVYYVSYVGTGYQFPIQNYDGTPSTTIVDMSDMFVGKDSWYNSGLWTFGGTGGSTSNPGMGLNVLGVKYSSPVQVGALTNWKSVACGSSSFTIATKTDGSLWAWGDNTYGALGINIATSYSSPIQVGSLTNWKQVAAGAYHSLYVKTDGTLWACGYNYSYGSLGIGSTSAVSYGYSSPVQVGLLTNWKQVAAAGNFSAAVKTDGTLWTWGGGQTTFNQGMLGNGTYNTSYLSPIQVGSGTSWKQISCGYTHMASVKTDGTLWSWGKNQYGQLGLSDNAAVGSGFGTTNQSSPIQVAGGSIWSTTDVSTQVVVGHGFRQRNFVGITSSGALWICGDNSFGNIGNGTVGVHYSSPVQVGSLTNWKSVSPSVYNMMAIKTDGTLWTWGYNPYGNLGNETTISYSSPIQVGSLTNWKQTSTGSLCTAAVKTDGTLWSWGWNDYGQLGNGTSVKYSSPVQVGTLTSWKQVCISGRMAAAVKTDGTLWTWGGDAYGSSSLGTGVYNVKYSSPVQVGSLTNWSQVAGDGYCCAAVKTDGTLWTWGWNPYGNLGNGTTQYYSSPIQVGSLTNWKYVQLDYAGGTKALKTDGTLWAWGNGTNGNLGNGTTLKYSSPIQIGALTNWTQVSCGYATWAYNSSGQIYSWGENTYGQLGTPLNYTGSISSPIQIGSLTNWKQVSCGQYHTTATKTDGTLWAWGYNNAGQLGNNATDWYSSPIQIGSLTNWKTAGGIYQSTYAIKTDGTLWSCGYNSSGNLGNGTVTSYSSPVQVGLLTNWKSLSLAPYSYHTMAIQAPEYYWNQ